MEIQSYQDLIVWQKAMDLALIVYDLVKYLPKEELYSLSSQMRRAAISVPSNIAEGQQRSSPKEFINFLSYAKGSVGELETQLILCVRLEYLESAQVKNALAPCREIGRMLNGLINTLKSRPIT